MAKKQKYIIAKMLSMIMFTAFTIEANASKNDYDFDLFLSTFTENIEFQKIHTRFPVEKLVVDSKAEPEPKAVEILLPKEKIVFPVIPNITEQAKNKLTLSIKEKTDNTVKVVIFKEDTGWLVFYIFKKDEIWKLVRIEDWSI